MNSGPRIAREPGGRRLGHLGVLAHAAANFLLVFAMQAQLSALDFGIFALVQVVFQFGLGLSNGLVCSPLVVAMAQGGGLPMARRFLRAMLLLCLTGAPLAGLVFWSLSGSVQFGVLVAALCALGWLRWFLRSAQLSRMAFRSPALADFASAAVLGGAALHLLASGTAGRDMAILWQVAATLAALAILLVAAPGLVRGPGRAPRGSYRASLRRHGGWAVTGVVATEATTNAHAWLVGFLLGPAAFAPIAAMALFFRPLPVLAQALTQYERPRMARHVAAGEGTALARLVGRVSAAMLGCLALNALAVAGLLAFLPHLVGNGSFARDGLVLVALLTAGAQLFTALRTGPSAALQAAGRFRPLAGATILSAPVTLGGVLLVIWLVPGQSGWVVAAVLCGEAVNALRVRRHYGDLRRSMGGGA